jgi:hypothetical protein
MLAPMDGSNSRTAWYKAGAKPFGTNGSGVGAAVLARPGSATVRMCKPQTRHSQRLQALQLCGAGQAGSQACRC